MGYWYFTYLKLFHLNDFDIPCYVLCSMFYARSVLPKSLRISPTFHWCANDVLLGDEPRLCEVPHERSTAWLSSRRIRTVDNRDLLPAARASLRRDVYVPRGKRDQDARGKLRRTLRIS